MLPAMISSAAISLCIMAFAVMVSSIQGSQSVCKNAVQPPVGRIGDTSYPALLTLMVNCFNGSVSWSGVSQYIYTVSIEANCSDNHNQSNNVIVAKNYPASSEVPESIANLYAKPGQVCRLRACYRLLHKNVLYQEEDTPVCTAPMSLAYSLHQASTIAFSSASFVSSTKISATQTSSESLLHTSSIVHIPTSSINSNPNSDNTVHSALLESSAKISATRTSSESLYHTSSIIHIPSASSKPPQITEVVDSPTNSNPMASSDELLQLAFISSSVLVFIVVMCTGILIIVLRRRLMSKPQPFSCEMEMKYEPEHQHVISNLRFGSVPVQIRCTSCQQDVVTTLRCETGLFTWLLVGLLFFFGLFLCCWIPLVIDGCKDVVHVCPRCQCVVGVYKRIG